MIDDGNYPAALVEIGRLLHLQPSLPLALEALAAEIEAFEKKRFPISAPTDEERRRFREDQESKG